MSSFEIVESLPAGRANRHSDLLYEFLAANTRYARVTDKEGVRTNTLTLIANQKELPIKVHGIKDEIYLERTDEDFAS
jgi:hypothetical protein